MRKVLLLAGTLAAISIVAFMILSQRRGDLVAIRQGDIEEAVYGLGKVKSNEIFEIKAGVLSRLSKAYVREGDKVEKGENLVRLDEALFRAPFRGTVTLLPFHESENVFPQNIVLRLENLADLYVEVTLEQQGALRVKKGQAAKISLESLRGLLVTGVVESIFPREDQFVARIKPEGFTHEVLPGMTADVAIQVGKRENVILAPLSALSSGRVTVQREGRRQKIAVKVGAIDRDWAEVTESDLKVGELVVTPRN